MHRTDFGLCSIEGGLKKKHVTYLNMYMNDLNVPPPKLEKA
jgi:hypothetical protein